MRWLLAALFLFAPCLSCDPGGGSSSCSSPSSTVQLGGSFLADITVTSGSSSQTFEDQAVWVGQRRDGALSWWGVAGMANASAANLGYELRVYSSFSLDIWADFSYEGNASDAYALIEIRGQQYHRDQDTGEVIADTGASVAVRYDIDNLRPLPGYGEGLDNVADQVADGLRGEWTVIPPLELPQVIME